MTLSARRRGRPALLFVAAVAAAILAVPRPAAAHQCPEWVNPHGETIPPAGCSTAPGPDCFSKQAPNVGNNPDGFYRLLGDNDLYGSCEPDDEPGFGLGGGGEDGGITNFFGTFSNGTTLKYTEANGKEPGYAPMAGNNGQGGGQSQAVDWHFWGQGDLRVCEVGSLTECICCRVAPPPKL